MTIDTYI